MIGAPLVQILVGLVGAGGIIGAVLAAIKVGPERSNIIVTAAQGAVIVQAGVIDELREQIADQGRRLEACEGHQATIDSLRTSVDRLAAGLQTVTLQRDRLRDENAELRERVAHLEDEVRILKRGDHQ